MTPLEKELLAALKAITGICQDSLEDHFGEKIGKQIQAAVKKGEAEK